MENIIKQVKEVAVKNASSLDIEIISVDYVREFGSNILRIIGRKIPSMSIDDASELNNLISEDLDKLDLIEDEYYLEVSSEGIEKELRTNSEIIEALGEYIYIEAKDENGTDLELYGTLNALDNEIVSIKVNQKGRIRTLNIAKNNIKLIRLAVKF